ncbi:MAG: PorP/SprF family type IX secretion system membrane protein [Cytophagales bacterium]|nr:PorP/SprF family type IX secretion system membrane protein [Cytophagales bacterium]
MKSLFLTCLFILYLLILASSLFGQKQFGNSFYIVNPYSYNTAYASDTQGLQASAQFSGQNSGLSSAPRHAHIFLATGLMEGRAGVGIRTHYSQSGILENTILSAEFSYVLPLNRDLSHVIRFGLSGGGRWESINLDVVHRNNYTNPSDPMFYDELSMTSDIQFGLGAVYQYHNFTTGFQIPFLIGLYQQGQKETWKNVIPMVSYTFKFSRKWVVIPTVLVNTLPSGLTIYDVVTLFGWEKGIWWQGGYRSSQAMIGGIGTTIQQIKIGYAFEIPFGNYAGMIGNQHSIMLKFSMPRGLGGEKSTENSSQDGSARKRKRR